MDTLKFSVGYEQFISDKGELLHSLPASVDNKERVINAYETMVLIREFDKKAIALQRTGQLGTYPSLLGQEAIGTAIGQALLKDDIFTPYYRDISTQYLRGVSLTEILLYWGGDERGSAFKNCPNDFPVCVPIATQYGHAAGAAIALKTRGQHHASLVTCGEGATSKGDFLETLNLAGAWQLPLVMVVNNNQWAISTPRTIQCGAKTIAQKAIGAGIEGVVVDGNDYFAILDAVQKALTKAYAGKGATLIEAVSYRLGDHTTADDASRYRGASELEAAWAKEPILRLQRFIQKHYGWSDENEQTLKQSISKEIDNAVTEYLSVKPEPPEAMFDYLYESLPKPLEDQYAQVKAKSLLGLDTENSEQSEAIKKGEAHESTF
jgi:pyruvate dehydrogenase E1 component alpha subunit